MDTLFPNMIENDLNPFLIFNKDSKVVYYNKEAEYILSYVNSKEIYDLALSLAPHNYGYKSTFIDVIYNRIKYYAILVGYEDDERLAVKLYKEVVNDTFNLKQENTTKTSIYTLIELAKSNSLSKQEIKINQNYDPSIPEMKLLVKEFLSLLNYIFSLFKNSQKLDISVSMKIAEIIRINNKRYPICMIKISPIQLKDENKNELLKLSKDTNTTLFVSDDSIVLEFAVVD